MYQYLHNWFKCGSISIVTSTDCSIVMYELSSDITLKRGGAKSTYVDSFSRIAPVLPYEVAEVYS